MGTVAGVVGRRWWLLLLPLVVVAAVAAGILAGRSPTYEAVATIRTGGNDLLAESRAAGVETAGDLLSDAETLLGSAGFLAEVAERAGVDDVGGFDVRPVGTTLVQITYVADDADEAGRVAGAAVDQLLRSRRARVAQAGDAAVELLQRRLVRLEEAETEAENELAAFEARNPAPGPDGPPLSRAVEAEAASLTAEVEQRQQAAAAVRAALGEAELGAQVALAEVAAEQLVDRPLSPGGDGLPLLLIALLVTFVGGGLGVGLALVAERRDDTVRDEVDVQEAAPGVPVLAVIDAS